MVLNYTLFIPNLYPLSPWVKVGLMSFWFSSALVHAPLKHKKIFLYRIKPCFSPTMHNKLFTQAEIRAISELRVRLVEAFQHMYFFCWQLQGGADFVDHFLNLYFMLLCCLHLEIYMLKTWHLPCTVVVCLGVKGAIKALLVWYWPDVGLSCLKYLELFTKFPDAAFKFISLRPKSHLITPYRKWTQK